MVRFSVLDPWTDPRGGEIERLRIDNGILALEVISLGGIIRALWTPDKHGERANIVLSCDSAEDYLTQSARLGAIAGRLRIVSLTAKCTIKAKIINSMSTKRLTVCTAAVKV